jgi:hypothetical protein
MLCYVLCLLVVLRIEIKNNNKNYVFEEFPYQQPQYT